jgi:hypothetical protein
MTKRDKLFRTLQRKWLTPLDAAIECGVFALSQRCGDFRREGHTVVDEWVKTLGGARVKRYRIVKPTKWTA